MEANVQFRYLETITSMIMMTISVRRVDCFVPPM